MQKNLEKVIFALKMYSWAHSGQKMKKYFNLLNNYERNWKLLKERMNN
jgi:hypothetical protein